MEAFSRDESADHVTDSVVLSPHYVPSTEGDESCVGPECHLFPSQCTTLSDVVDPVELRDVYDDILFDQYLRSPSPSPPPSPLPSPDDAASELSGVTLINTVCCQRTGGEKPCKEPFKEPSRVEYRSPGPEHASENQEARCQEDIGHLNNNPHIRLRVSRPRITLRLTLPATGQVGMKEKKKAKRKTGHKETPWVERKKVIKIGKARKGKKATKSEKTREGQR